MQATGYQVAYTDSSGARVFLAGILSCPRAAQRVADKVARGGVAGVHVIDLAAERAKRNRKPQAEAPAGATCFYSGCNSAPSPGRKSCKPCRDKDREYQRAWRAERRARGYKV